MCPNRTPVIIWLLILGLIQNIKQYWSWNKKSLFSEQNKLIIVLQLQRIVLSLFRHSFLFTVHDALFWLQKLVKTCRNLAGCISLCQMLKVYRWLGQEILEGYHGNILSRQPPFSAHPIKLHLIEKKMVTSLNPHRN